MDIITASVGVLFTLCLAALAVTPTLLGVYLELRAQKRHGTQQNASELSAAFPPRVPFNFSHIFFGEKPKESGRHLEQEDESELLTVYPPPVPFNSQIFWRSVRRASPGTPRRSLR